MKMKIGLRSSNPKSPLICSIYILSQFEYFKNVSFEKPVTAHITPEALYYDLNVSPYHVF